MVHTLVSPISTCHSAPEDTPESLDDPRRLEPIEAAEFCRRRPFTGAAFDMAPALELERFFFTRPPSFDGKSDAADVGEPGALSTSVCCPK
jgi:hypothetical protein